MFFHCLGFRARGVGRLRECVGSRGQRGFVVGSTSYIERKAASGTRGSASGTTAQETRARAAKVAIPNSIAAECRQAEMMLLRVLRGWLVTNCV